MVEVLKQDNQNGTNEIPCLFEEAICSLCMGRKCAKCGHNVYDHKLDNTCEYCQITKGGEC